ncbi:O-antigen ligase family protein [Francisella frigiditurris]|uniref:O-Antigen ligase family protein n=1 Tax=Francisella frigiditurris TaxID=1542390 RepID=A0A1J0KWF5_9GAMM|nr:O-antigen ligase family protein [Francisella frigiditurris]APC97995.1 O-Antigen ligase family protein [Francisella frigiditurris]
MQLKQTSFKMLQNIKKIQLDDFIFYFLSILLFTIFLMPYREYIPMNIVISNTSGGTKYLNDIISANKNLFFERYTLLFYGTSFSLFLILINKKILQGIILRFLSLNKTNIISIILFFIFGFISACFAISPSIAFKGVGFTLAMLILSIFIANYIQQKPEKIKYLFIIVLLSIIFYGGMLFLQLSLSNFSIYGQTVAGNIQKVLLFTYNTLNPRFLDNYFSWFVPFLLLPWIMNYRPILKIGAFLALSIIWFVIINHTFRTIFLEYIIIFIFLAIFDRKLLAKIFILIILSLLVGALINLGIHELVLVQENKSVTTLFRDGDSGRFLIWREAFRIGLEHPLTGIGQWNYIAVTKTSETYPHNLFLEIWSQWGIPAFICFIIIIGYSIRFTLINLKDLLTHKPYNIFLFMLIAGMIDGMLNAMFKTSLGLFGAIFVFGLFMSSYKVKEECKSISLYQISILRIIISITIFSIVIIPLIWKPLWV